MLLVIAFCVLFSAALSTSSLDPLYCVEGSPIPPYPDTQVDVVHFPVGDGRSLILAIFATPGVPTDIWAFNESESTWTLVSQSGPKYQAAFIFPPHFAFNLESSCLHGLWTFSSSSHSYEIELIEWTFDHTGLGGRCNRAVISPSQDYRPRGDLWDARWPLRQRGPWPHTVVRRSTYVRVACPPN